MLCGWIMDSRGETRWIKNSYLFGLLVFAGNPNARKPLFKAHCQKQWAWVGLKNVSPLAYYQCAGLFQLGVMIECGLSLFFIEILYTANQNRLLDSLDPFWRFWEGNCSFHLLFYGICAIPFCLLLVFLSGHVVTKAFVTTENQTRFGFFFEAAQLFGKQRLYTALILFMYSAALWCVLTVGWAIEAHAANSDFVFQLASDTVILFFLTVLVWHLSYQLHPLGNIVNERFKATFYDPLMGVIFFFITLSFFGGLWIGHLEETLTCIYLLISGSLLVYKSFFTLPPGVPVWLLSLRSGGYSGLMATLIRYAFGWTAPFSANRSVNLLCYTAPIAFSIITGLLHYYTVGQRHRARTQRAMKLLNNHKERILLNSVKQGQHLVSAAALAGGAAPDRVDSKGDTLLHIAAWMNIPHAARVLLKFGADSNCANRVKLSALHIAASQLHPEITGLLLNHGARVNAKDMHGRAPIHRICSNSRASDSYRGMRCLKMLLKNGADPWKPDFYGFSAFDLAQKWNADQYTRILLKSTKAGKNSCSGA